MEVRRSEAEAFADLARLCVEPGYIHAIGPSSRSATRNPCLRLHTQADTVTYSK